jgi:hypothetical protein
MTWDDVFRRGVASAMTTAELEALADGLRVDDPALVQGATYVPDPYGIGRARPCACIGGCAIGYAAWKSGRAWTHEVSGRFDEVALACNRLLGGEVAASVRFFTAFFDERPRDEVRRELLPVVEDIIKERRNGER